MWIPEDLVLQDEWVRLEPLGPQHDEGLLALASLETFRYYLTFPPSLEPSAWAEYMAGVRAMPGVVGFAVWDRVTGRLAGQTTYMDIRPAHRGLEIGMTWYGEEFRGTHVNPAAKRLLLAYAFETAHAIRVQLKSDARNAHSRRAMEKLGARFEGVLRNHGIQSDGVIRDTAMYSLLPEEWPAVREGLDHRLSLASSLGER